MLYPNSRKARLPAKVFQNLGAEYRGTPFWSWNTRVTDALVKDQIDVFRRMGFGGFHVHPRTGRATAYMSEEALRFILCNNYNYPHIAWGNYQRPAIIIKDGYTNTVTL